MKPIPIFNFSKLSDDELNTKALFVISCMTGNPKYPDATTRVAKVKTAQTEFETALSDAQDGGRLKTIQKDESRKALEKALKELALYVQLNCNDDLATMLSSGFDGHQDRSPSEELPPPEGFTVVLGPNSGCVTVSVDANSKTKVYVFEYALVPESGDPVWKVVFGSRKEKIKNLIPKKDYMFRAALKGTLAELNYSQTITLFII